MNSPLKWISLPLEIHQGLCQGDTNQKAGASTLVFLPASTIEPKKALQVYVSEAS